MGADGEGMLGRCRVGRGWEEKALSGLAALSTGAYSSGGVSVGQASSVGRSGSWCPGVGYGRGGYVICKGVVAGIEGISEQGE